MAAAGGLAEDRLRCRARRLTALLGRSKASTRLASQRRPSGGHERSSPNEYRSSHQPRILTTIAALGLAPLLQYGHRCGIPCRRCSNSFRALRSKLTPQPAQRTVTTGADRTLTRRPSCGALRDRMFATSPRTPGCCAEIVVASFKQSSRLSRTQVRPASCRCCESERAPRARCPRVLTSIVLADRHFQRALGIRRDC